MALIFPLPLAQFVGLLPIRNMTLDLPELVTTSRTRGGEVLQAERGARLWQGQMDLDVMTSAEAAQTIPLINLLRGAGASFMLSDPLRAWPQADPARTIAGASAKIVAAVGRELSLNGLPAGYTLQRGDLISWTYAASPVRYALHEIVSASVSANASGVTGQIEVTPPIRPDGTLAGVSVRLITPWCKAQIIPGSVNPGRRRRGGFVEDMSFQFIQTLR